MNFHPLALELSNLRESSKNAVANGTSQQLDSLKKYLHVEREVEKELEDTILRCSSEGDSKLILVCGNVGDGKSHILSFLHSKHLNQLSGFRIHNDATESHNPNESSNDTLHKLLENFRDVNIDNSSDKIILAINLGTLSKFLDEYRSEYNRLYVYVTDKKILDTNVIYDDYFDAKSPFHHVNFTDYHIYSLTAEGPKSLIITSLLEKIVSIGYFL